MNAPQTMTPRPVRSDKAARTPRTTPLTRFPAFQVFLVLLLPIIICASCARTTPSVKKITARDVASTVQMKLGDTLEIALEGNPTTGYTWAVASKVAQLQQQGEWELKRDSNLIGAGGTIILRFKAVREGEATLQLIYHRVWEKGVPPVKTFEVKVVVGKGSTADAPGERSR